MPRSARPPTPWTTSEEVKVSLYVVPTFRVTVLGSNVHWRAVIVIGTTPGLAVGVGVGVALAVGVGVGVAASGATTRSRPAAEEPAAFDAKCAALYVPGCEYV